jgi:hypothetical protein
LPFVAQGSPRKLAGIQVTGIGAGTLAEGIVFVISCTEGSKPPQFGSFKPVTSTRRTVKPYGANRRRADSYVLAIALSR